MAFVAIGLKILSHNSSSTASAIHSIGFCSTENVGVTPTTKHKTFCYDAQCLDQFQNLILTNWKSWYTYAKDKGHDISAEDIILVTGDFSPQRSGESPMLEPLYNQCVFLRGYRVYQRRKVLDSRRACGPEGPDVDDGVVLADNSADVESVGVPVPLNGSNRGSEGGAGSVTAVVNVPKVLLVYPCR